MKAIILAVLVAVALTLAAIALHPSTADFSPDNPFWNGYSKLVSRLKVVVVDDPSRLTPPEDYALIMVPYSDVDGGLLSRVRGFVEGGGTLILMDDYGRGGEVLGYLGVDVKLPRGVLRDPLINYRGPELPKAFTHGRVEGVDRLVLNYATVIEGAPESSVLAWSSSFSYLDLDLDGVRDEGEPMGPLPVAARFRVGRGLVVVVSDPSIAINSMLTVEDNEAFIERLAGGRRLALLSTTLPSTPLAQAKRVLREAYSGALRARVPIILASIALAAAALGASLRRRGSAN